MHPSSCKSARTACGRTRRVVVNLVSALLWLAGLNAQTPMAKARLTTRKGCSVLRCKRRLAAAGLCGTHLLQKADKVFSLYIRERDGRCSCCGESHRLQCMHVISRRYRRLRWNPKNAVAGCLMCHAEYTNKPLEWEDWVEQRFGDGTWSALRTEALDGIPDWKALAVECLTRYSNLRGNDESHASANL